MTRPPSLFLLLLEVKSERGKYEMVACDPGLGVQRVRLYYSYNL